MSTICKAIFLLFTLHLIQTQVQNIRNKPNISTSSGFGSNIPNNNQNRQPFCQTPFVSRNGVCVCLGTLNNRGQCIINSTPINNFPNQNPFNPQINQPINPIIPIPFNPSQNQPFNPQTSGTRLSSTLKNIIRSFDGTGNNLFNNGWGATHTSQVRKSFANYLDGFSQMDNSRVSPRLVSNTLGTLTSQSPVADQHNLNILFTIFGQFINHDIELTPSGS
jgi:hypothetical protein